MFVYPLFKTDFKKKKVRAHDVLQVVHQAASRVDPDLFVTPRTLRHCFATHLMDAGVDLKTISMLMGHKSPSESGVYLHASTGSKFTAVNRLNIQQSTNEEDEVI